MADEADQSVVVRPPSLNDTLPDRLPQSDAISNADRGAKMRGAGWGHADGKGNAGIAPPPIPETPVPSGSAGSKLPDYYG
jgi:hypothetical protein